MNYRSFSAFAALALGCGGAQPGLAPAQRTPPTAPVVSPLSSAPKGIEPPASGVAPSAPFPAITHRELENGLAVRVVERRVHPIIELRLVVRTGSAADGSKPGLAGIAGELLKAGGAGGMSPQKLVERAEALGSSLNVATDRDSTRISLSVTTGDLEPALEILAALAQKPAFSPVELAKLKAREVERVKSSARGSAAWAASMVLYRELYEVPTGVHPYSRYDALPAELEKITLQDCRAWHQANFVPGNAALIVAGDVSPEAVEAGARKWFGAWKGEAPPNLSFSQPFPPKEREVYLVDRPSSAQSQIYVGMLGSDSSQPDFPALSAANQILGGGVSSRLFLDVREKRSLAYSTGSALSDPAHGPGVVVLSAGTQTAKAPEAVAALLENLQSLAEKPAQAAELETATRFLNDSFVFKLETVGSVVELTSKLYILGLGDDYYDEYRKTLRGLDLRAVSSVATRYYQKTPVIVVAGDAATLGPELAKFGPVAVVDPEHEFSLKKSYPRKP